MEIVYGVDKRWYLLDGDFSALVEDVSPGLAQALDALGENPSDDGVQSAWESFYPTITDAVLNSAGIPQSTATPDSLRPGEEVLSGRAARGEQPKYPVIQTEPASPTDEPAEQQPGSFRKATDLVKQTPYGLVDAQTGAAIPDAPEGWVGPWPPSKVDSFGDAYIDWDDVRKALQDQSGKGIFTTQQEAIGYAKRSGIQNPQLEWAGTGWKVSVQPDSPEGQLYASFDAAQASAPPGYRPVQRGTEGYWGFEPAPAARGPQTIDAAITEAVLANDLDKAFALNDVQKQMAGGQGIPLSQALSIAQQFATSSEDFMGLFGLLQNTVGIQGLQQGVGNAQRVTSAVGNRLGELVGQTAQANAAPFSLAAPVTPSLQPTEPAATQPGATPAPGTMEAIGAAAREKYIAEHEGDDNPEDVARAADEAATAAIAAAQREGGLLPTSGADEQEIAALFPDQPEVAAALVNGTAGPSAQALLNQRRGGTAGMTRGQLQQLAAQNLTMLTTKYASGVTPGAVTIESLLGRDATLDDIQGLTAERIAADTGIDPNSAGLVLNTLYESVAGKHQTDRAGVESLLKQRDPANLAKEFAKRTTKQIAQQVLSQRRGQTTTTRFSLPGMK